MKRVLRSLALAALIGASIASPAASLGARSAGTGADSTFASFDPNTDGQTISPDIDTGDAIVQLTGDPLSAYSRTQPPPGKKIDFSSATVQSYRAQLSAERNNFRQWLQANAPAANITGAFDIALNAVSVQLNGTSLATIATAPMVQQATYEAYYQPAVDDPDLGLIHAIDAWTAAGGGPPNPTAGQGVKVAIIDTGIDITHPCFSDAGYPSQTRLGDHSFTNNKVIVAKVFNNRTPSQDYTPEALQAHGTHVAGTVACDYNTPATVTVNGVGVPIPHGISGVAPRALLGNYNVFPGNVTNARSEDIFKALEAAYADGFDVANMSLGGGKHGVQDLLEVAVNNLDKANMVVAVAAGNAGAGGPFTVESPGAAADALTAGAATVGHFIGAPVTVGATTYPAVVGQFATVSANLTAPLAVVTGAVNGLGIACSALSGGLTGKIALISRGSCTFSTKIRNAQNAGAVAVLVANNVAGDGIGMAQDGTPNQPTIPAYMVSLTDGQALKADDGASTTIGATLQYFVTGNNDFMAGFSSQGPTIVDYRVKPDVIAPGVNVLSSIPHQFCATPPCFAFFQGTSMATPHLAGSAAVVLWAHPGWSAAEVRSAIVNTADQGVLKKSRSTALETNVNIVGAGRENLLSAFNAQVALDPVSVSFGGVPSGSGQTRTFDVTLTNLTSLPETLSIGVGAGDSSVAYSVSPSSINLAASDSAKITLTMTAQKGAAPNGHQAILTISNGATQVAHAAVFTWITMA